MNNENYKYGLVELLVLFTCNTHNNTCKRFSDERLYDRKICKLKEKTRRYAYRWLLSYFITL